MFQFVVLSALRAAQLMRGCEPRVDGAHKAIVTAQLEVSEGRVAQLIDQADSATIPHVGAEGPLPHLPPLVP
jgi:DNA-directed RNA polymerase subunit K/omega